MDEIAYLDAAATTDVGIEYKRRSAELLDLRAGLAVVDVGCGPGTDLGRLADLVGDGGRVVGVDREPEMLAEARRRLAGRDNISVRAGDVHALPLADAAVDRVRVDRVLQHVLEPERALGEVRRVLRPGGLFGMAEPDWDTLAVGDEDVETSRRFASFVGGRVRNPTIGRELAWRCARAGFTVRDVEPIAVLFRDFSVADRILGLRRNIQRAVQAGQIAGVCADAWIERLASGPLVAGFTVYLVLAEA